MKPRLVLLLVNLAFWPHGSVMLGLWHSWPDGN